MEFNEEKVWIAEDGFGEANVFVSGLNLWVNARRVPSSKEWIPLRAFNSEGESIDIPDHFQFDKKMIVNLNANLDLLLDKE